ncbi:M48 family metalloprotease [Chitinimonas taiwanensis]|uniref:M48 family metalloprotease n=1 Tax=Chitinimonas taiwanensis TaxID=240412 RepID=UPI0035B35CF5
MLKHLATLLLLFTLGASPLQAAEPDTTATSSVTPAAQAAPPALDPKVATQAFMDRLQGEARAKSDSYAEGGYWLLLWNLLYGLLVAWLLLSRQISARIRDFAERRSQGKNRQVLIYALIYTPLTTLLMLPLSLYEGYFREHQYGLSNLSLAGWLGEFGIALLVNTLLMGVALLGLYALLRRQPRSWWAWGGVGGAGLIALLIMIAPVFISPLFNTYKPLPQGQIRDEILSMARANGIPVDNVYYFDASKQTKRVSANVSGLFGTTRIALNDNLLQRTSLPEIRAVMAHEMGHYVLNHSFKLALYMSLLLMGGLLFIKLSWDWAAERFANRHGVRGISDPAGLPLLVALLSVYLFMATPVFSTIIRSAETEADLFGLNASREPDGFAEAIFKLAEYRKLQPGPVEEFIFFDHPSGYQRIYAAMRWKAEQQAAAPAAAPTQP